MICNWFVNLKDRCMEHHISNYGLLIDIYIHMIMVSNVQLQNFMVCSSATP